MTFEFLKWNVEYNSNSECKGLIFQQWGRNNEYSVTNILVKDFSRAPRQKTSQSENFHLGEIPYAMQDQQENKFTHWFSNRKHEKGPQNGQAQWNLKVTPYPRAYSHIETSALTVSASRRAT